MSDRSPTVTDRLPGDLPAWVPEVLSQLGLLRRVVAELRDEVRGRQKPYMTVREAADLCGRSEYTIRRWVSEHRVRATKVAGTGPHGRLLLAREDLDRLVTGTLVTPQPLPASG